MNHAFVTVFVPFLGGREKDEKRRRENRLGALLDELGKPTSAADPCPQALDQAARSRLSRRVHFLSMIVLPEGDGLSAYLVLEVCADGSAEEVLPCVVDAMGATLRRVVRETGIQAPATDTELLAFLERHRIDGSTDLLSTPALVFSGTPEMTVRRILGEGDLAQRLREILERLEAKRKSKARHKSSALGMLRYARRRIFTDVDLKWAFTSEPVALLGEPKPALDLYKAIAWAAIRDYLWVLIPVPALVGLWHFFVLETGLLTPVGYAVIALLIELGIGAIVFLVGYMLLRRQEDNDVPYDAEPEKEHVEGVMRRENTNGTVQNHLGGVSILKRGLIRRVSLRFALWLIAELRAGISRPGFLNRIGTIHFARWILLPNSDRLVFLSNYDGSWQSYLEDFIARLREGLTSVWSNTRDFPKTTSLFLGGAEDGARFKRWARRQQLPSRFWFSAYPQLSTGRIRANAAIRHGFASASTEAQAAKWLALFGYSAPENVEKDEVSSLALGGLPFFRFAHCLLVQFADAARGQKWVESVQGGLSFGEHAALEKQALVAAFTAEGLRMLDLDEAAVATFPTAFQEGMSATQRARALGDESTAEWKWGGGGGSGGVHAALFLYARDDAVLRMEIAKRRSELEQDYGHKVLRQVPMKKLKKDPKTKALDIREPFGFRDGVSQPIMRGTKHWSRPENEIHVVEPGELLLGYRDNLGNVSPTPSRKGEDIGRNGTFLVIRQLEQNKAGFDSYLASEAAKLNGDPRVQGLSGPDLQEWIAAAMVGRWRDGSSLVRFPHPPSTAPNAPPRLPDNDFRFGREDPDGLRCPFGAHIRRANPRDSFEPGSELQLAISNRHRILRVGRTYEPKPGKNPGLLFMCVNADIERQFEFLQQTWILGSNFHGLDNEIDPIVGYRGKNDAMTVPTARGPVRLQGFSRFVKVLGGGYFFIPGKRATRLLAGSADYGAP